MCAWSWICNSVGSCFFSFLLCCMVTMLYVLLTTEKKNIILIWANLYRFKSDKCFYWVRRKWTKSYEIWFVWSCVHFLVLYIYIERERFIRMIDTLLSILCSLNLIWRMEKKVVTDRTESQYNSFVFCFCYQWTA